MDRILFNRIKNQYIIDNVGLYGLDCVDSINRRTLGQFARYSGFRRDKYGALYRVNSLALDSYHRIYLPDPVADNAWAQAHKCITAIESRGTDEHGGWQQYIDFDKHGRGSCINVDVYGIDVTAGLYVIQVRQFERRHKRGYGNVRKTYFLIGHNENGNPFAHPVSAHKIHAAIRRNPSIESPVRAAQAWIWGIEEFDLDRVLRNGDTALIPITNPPGSTQDITPASGMLRVVDSHWLYSRNIRSNGTIYAKNPTLRHFKGQHPTVRGKGWYRVMIGNRAAHHDFAKPTID
ncbi:MAG: hypothetical protein PVG39_29460 [Desulfobacteraceae bacterium]|jgi:hypothetical protein